MPRPIKDIIRSINVLQAIQTLEQVASTGKNESARVAAAMKLLEVAGLAKGEGATADAENFYKGIMNSDETNNERDTNQLEEISKGNSV